ncbi:hypothetical protein C4J81_15370 [Deltaproteobacteria bacterium Smac51]|nr:hypothetical protein C4J81_10105 [Deltaproteobacteria bacterium Smac51]UQZ90510.1 hypothetical protein C4J81_15370 [Deltaproteobacteria bacterium Smac51]
MRIKGPSIPYLKTFWRRTEVIDPIATIEQAIVARLALLQKMGRWPFTCKYIDSYGGQFESAEEIAQAAAKAPGLWVVFDGETGTLENGIHAATLTYAVFVLARSFSPEQLRHGGEGVTGLYQLIEAVRKALVNQTLGADMTPLVLDNIIPLWRGGPQGGGISLSAMRFSTVVDVEVPADYELDGNVCSTPLYVTSWDVEGLPVITDKRKVFYERHDNNISETESWPAGSGPEPEPAPAFAGRWPQSR